MTASTDPSFPGMTPTGRRLKGPASELIELTGDEGALFTAIVYQPDFATHPLLRENARLALNFMECPMVAGLADLVEHDLEAGWYVYATGSSRSIYEALKAYRDAGGVVGQRAALELCYLAGMALMEAGESGPTQGVFSHGDLNAHRLLLSPEGQVIIIGHGLPQIELLAERAGGKVPVREDSLRSCPPERLVGAAEDASSDLLALTLVAFELMTGRELYAGSLADVRRIAEHAEGPALVQKEGKTLPKAIREWMEMALQFDPTRRMDPTTYIHTLYGLLSDTSITGDSLGDVASKVFGASRRGRQLASSDHTEAIPRRALQRTAGGAIGSFVQGGLRRAGAEEAGPAQPDNRWGAVSRAASVSESDEDGSERRRRRRGEAEPEAPARRRRRGEPEEQAPTRRRRRDAGEPEEAAPEASASEDAPLRRRRREPTEPAEPAESESSSSPEETPRRRRREPTEPAEPAESESSSSPEETPRRRRREPTEPSEAAEPESASSSDESPRRRRREPKRS